MDVKAAPINVHNCCQMPASHCDMFLNMCMAISLYHYVRKSSFINLSYEKAASNDAMKLLMALQLGY